MDKPKLALAHLVESRPDFYTLRESLVREEILSLGWLRDLAALLIRESGFYQATKGQALRR